MRRLEGVGDPECLADDGSGGWVGLYNADLWGRDEDAAAGDEGS